MAKLLIQLLMRFSDSLYLINAAENDESTVDANIQFVKNYNTPNSGSRIEPQPLRFCLFFQA